MVARTITEYRHSIEVWSFEFTLIYFDITGYFIIPAIPLTEAAEIMEMPDRILYLALSRIGMLSLQDISARSDWADQSSVTEYGLGYVFSSSSHMQGILTTDVCPRHTQNMLAWISLFST
jgi:hypothetical protein